MLGFSPIASQPTSAEDLAAILSIVEDQGPIVGGDDVPEERIEVWSKPKAPRKHDDALDTIMRQAMDKAMGRQPVKPQPAIEHIPVNAPVIAGQALVEYDEEDDEETLLLLL